MNIYLGFILCATAIVLAGWFLSYHGDVIAEKTKLGRSFVGLIGLAAITSLPELITTTTAILVRDAPDLSFGNVFGSNMFNIFIISILEIIILRKPFLYLVSKKNLSYIAFIFLASMSALLGLEGYDFSITWISIHSIFIFMVYLMAMYTGFTNSREEIVETNEYHDKSLKKSLIIFIFLGLIIITAGSFGTVFADKIALRTGLGRTFVGGLFLAIMTSLPEVITSISSVRLKAYDMVIGNLLGSNLFNISIIFIADILYTDSSIFANMKDRQFIPVIFSLIVLTLMFIGMLRKPTKADNKKLNIETVFIFIFYVLGIYLIYNI